MITCAVCERPGPLVYVRYDRVSAILGHDCGDWLHPDCVPRRPPVPPRWRGTRYSAAKPSGGRRSLAGRVFPFRVRRVGR